MNNFKIIFGIITFIGVCCAGCLTRENCKTAYKYVNYTVQNDRADSIKVYVIKRSYTGYRDDSLFTVKAGQSITFLKDTLPSNFRYIDNLAVIQANGDTLRPAHNPNYSETGFKSLVYWTQTISTDKTLLDYTLRLY